MAFIIASFTLLVVSTIIECHQIPVPRHYHEVFRRSTNDTSSENSTTCNSTCILIITACILLIVIACLAGSVYYATCKPQVEKFHDNWDGKKLARKRPIYGNQVSLTQLNNNINQLGFINTVSNFQSPETYENNMARYQEQEQFHNGVFYDSSKVRTQYLNTWAEETDVPFPYPDAVVQERQRDPSSRIRDARLFSLYESFENYDDEHSKKKIELNYTPKHNVSFNQMEDLPSIHKPSNEIMSSNEQIVVVNSYSYENNENNIPIEGVEVADEIAMETHEFSSKESPLLSGRKELQDFNTDYANRNLIPGQLPIQQLESSPEKAGPYGEIANQNISMDDVDISVETQCTNKDIREEFQAESKLYKTKASFLPEHSTNSDQYFLEDLV